MTDIVPAESALPIVVTPAFVTAALGEAKSWLARANTDDLSFVSEFKSRAEAMRCYVTQKEFGKEAELSAAEIVRRAERRIAELIREGQAKGEIRRAGQNVASSRSLEARLGVPGASSNLGPSEAAGVKFSADLKHMYAMADGVAAERFEDAITEARAEGNLTRTNVVRKLKPNKVAPLKSSKPATSRNARRIDSNRIVRETVHALEGVVLSLAYVEFADLDADEVEGWAESLTDSLKELNRFKKELTR